MAGKVYGRNLLGVVVVMLFLVAGVLLYLSSEGPRSALSLAVFGAIGLLMVSTCLRCSVVSDEALTHYAGFFGLKETIVAWPDVVSVVASPHPMPDGTRFVVRGASGRIELWSRDLGFPALLSEILAHVPESAEIDLGTTSHAGIVPLTEQRTFDNESAGVPLSFACAVMMGVVLLAASGTAALGVAPFDTLSASALAPVALALLGISALAFGTAYRFVDFCEGTIVLDPIGIHHERKRCPTVSIAWADVAAIVDTQSRPAKGGLVGLVSIVTSLAGTVNFSVIGRNGGFVTFNSGMASVGELLEAVRDHSPEIALSAGAQSALPPAPLPNGKGT